MRRLQPPLSPTDPNLFVAVSNWWREQRSRSSAPDTWRKAMAMGWEFVRDSLPDRKRQRYGDADYDWEHHVNTTSGGVGWRARLLGLLHSSYQPIEQDLFYRMLNALAIDFTGFTFVDIGSGKGRALLMASSYPFSRIVGIELLPELNRIAQDNIRRYLSPHRRCSEVEALCGDATTFPFPREPLVVFLFHPLQERGFAVVMANLEQSWRENPRPVYVIYANPVFENLLQSRRGFHKLGGTHQYALFRLAGL